MNMNMTETPMKAGGPPVAKQADQPKFHVRTKRSEYDRRLTALETEYSSWRAHHQEISDYVLPRRTRFSESETNRGTKQNTKIINGTATLAVRTSSGGMMTNVTSPASPWFKLGVPDPLLGADQEVKDWLADCEGPLRLILGKSNFYNALSDGIYEDMLAFGTACMLIEEDEDEIIRCYPLILGTYFLACDAAGRVNALYRKLRYTTAQMVDEFGIDRVSSNVRRAYFAGDLDSWHGVTHVIESNKCREPGAFGPKGMKWCSVWYEHGSPEVGAFLRESGYREFPVVAPRWSLRPGDSYGRSPTMDCLGDVKALQKEELNHAEGIDKSLNPALVGPQVLQQQGVSLIPRTVNYLPNGTTAELKPVAPVIPGAMEVNERSLSRREYRIKVTLFSDLWAMFSQDERNDRATAEEVRAKKEERLLLLGSPVERMNKELFHPAIERVFAIAMRRGLVPAPPKRMLQKKAEYSVEFTSVLHAALKAVGIASIERTVGFIGNLAGLDPRAIKKLNIERTIEAHGDATGLPPHLLRSDQEVQKIIAEEQRQMMAMEQAKAQAQATAKGVGPGAVPPGPSAGAAPIDPAALAVAAQADQGQPGATNTILNALGPQAAGGGFPSTAGMAA